MHNEMTHHNAQYATQAFMDSCFAMPALTISLNDIIIRRRRPFYAGCDGV